MNPETNFKPDIRSAPETSELDAAVTKYWNDLYPTEIEEQAKATLLPSVQEMISMVNDLGITSEELKASQKLIEGKGPTQWNTTIVEQKDLFIALKNKFKGSSYQLSRLGICNIRQSFIV